MILPLLSGLAQGAGETFGKIADEERQKKTQNDRLVAGALLDKLKDPTLSPEDHDNLSRQYYKTLGMKGGDIEQIMQAHNYMRQAAQDHEAQNGPPPTPAPTEKFANPQGLAGPIPGTIGANFPPEGTPLTNPGLGEVPSLPVAAPTPRRTMGDLAEAQKSKDLITQGRTANIVDEEKKKTELANQIELYKSYTGQRPTNDQIAQLLNMQPKYRPLVGHVAPRTIAGADALAAAAGGLDLDGNQIDPTGEYQRVLEPDGVSTHGFIKTLQRANGAEWVQIQKEGSAQPIWGHIYRDKTGNITKIDQTPGLLPPSGYLESDKTSTRNIYKVVQQANGDETLVPVTETSRNTSTPQLPAAGNGAVPGAAPAGQSVPGSGATGALPKASSITPASPLPSAPNGLGGGVAVPQGPDPYGTNIHPGIVVGSKPLTQGEFSNLNNARSGLRAIQQMEESIKEDPNILYKAAGPLSLGARKFAKARGEAIDIVTRLRTGAALNEEEEEHYKGLMPSAADKIGEYFEPGVIQDALDRYKLLYNGVIQQYGRRAPQGYGEGNFFVDPNKIPKQTSATGSAKPTTSTPTTPLPKDPNAKIEVTGPDGKPYRLTQAGIDAAAQDGVIFKPKGK